MSTKVVTGKVRFSYAHVFEPTAMEEGQEKKYNVAILIPKTDKVTVKKIQDAIKEAKESGTAKFGAKFSSGNLRNPFYDGDIEKPEDEAYAGHYYLNAKSIKRPAVVDIDRNEILDKEEFYSGCYGRVSLDFFPYNNVSKGIAAGLGNLQKLEDGPRLGGEITTAEDDFGGENEYDDMM